MAERLIVSLEDLKRAMSLLVNHVAANEGENVGLEHDHFWSIPAEELYNVYSSPQDLTIGPVG